MLRWTWFLKVRAKWAQKSSVKSLKVKSIQVTLTFKEQVQSFI